MASFSGAAAQSHVVDVTEATFQRDVIDYSHTAPVVVDFWAAWCGPCKSLGPILEELAGDARGAFRLAKVDVDANAALAQYFRAQSIPMVVAIANGQLVDQFTGALPKGEVQAFLARVLEAAGVTLESEPGAPTDPVAAEAFWREALEADAEDGQALLELGKVLMGRGQMEEAQGVLKRVQPRMDQYNSAQTALAAQELLADVAAAGGEAAVRERLAGAPDDREAAYLVACVDGVAGRFVDSLGVLVGLVASSPPEVKDKAKRAAAILFDSAGREDAEVEKLRRKLGRLLF